MTPPRWWLPLAVVLVATLAGLGAPRTVEAATPASFVLRTGLPDRTLTPGATNPAVTQATIGRTICVTGWTLTVRPSSRYTRTLEIKHLAVYGFSDRNLAHYEEDHLIPLELGGAPADPANLWPEPYHLRVVDGTDLGAYAKDRLETYLKKAVCDGHIPLAAAQARMRGNWVAWWRITFNAPGATVTSAQAVRLGDGAARLTLYSDGSGVLYVNLKGLASGTWNEHLWDGSCDSLGTRVAVLPGLAVPLTGAIARTNRLDPVQAVGRTIRIVHGSTALCATFAAGSP